jgi:2-succinyl-5-enolpyruvyl-6-hydroxy-3-cyclohexene-1-carboxylate synthase
VLVTGDLAFLHDSGGLLAAKLYGIPLTIVLIDNDGGGIFEMLPVAAFGEAYERHFGTPHGVEFAPLCAAYGIPLLRPKDWAEFRTLVAEGLTRPGARVIAIKTDRRRNRAQHLAVWEAVARRIEAAFPAGRPV